MWVRIWVLALDAGVELGLCEIIIIQWYTS